MTKIKICGLTRQEDVESVNRWLPDYTGFVFSPSRRQVTPEQAGRLKAELDPRIKAVGVFVNEPVSLTVKLCRAGVIDAVQLHGDESETYIRKLKDQINCPLIKAVRVQNTEQVLQAGKLSVDLLLLDTYQKGQYGGSGKTFDYELIPNLQKRYFLAGGLKNSNIVQAIRKCKPYGVDISSGVETDSLKDDDKIREIICTVRSLDKR
ncbi:MAG TPA: N-(5'-phosphoribosyl)anthranilate isomerase [Syntrophomonas sp.]|nr:N-(5'-phosphoribosyl)anthranilate isomerase [Syntrophomonas sp.]